MVKKKNSRISWDEYFMKIAQLAALRSTCNRAAVGAVLTINKRVISTGYNGSPPGLPHCSEEGCLMENNHCIRTIHAEANAIIHCAKVGISTDGATLYTTMSPCFNCAKTIIAAGVKEVVCGIDYQDTRPLKLLKESGVKVRKLLLEK